MEIVNALVDAFPETFSDCSDDSLSKILKMPVNGYHCVNHALGVADIAYNGAKWENIDTSPLTLGLAGLFHDAGHTRQASNPDYLNLAQSVGIWHEFFESSAELQSFIDREEVTALIISTNSALAPKDNYSEAARLLYDADTLDGLRVLDSPAALQAYMECLADEGYQSATNPEGFVEMRGLFSEAGNVYWRGFQARHSK